MGAASTTEDLNPWKEKIGQISAALPRAGSKAPRYGGILRADPKSPMKQKARSIAGMRAASGAPKGWSQAQNFVDRWQGGRAVPPSPWGGGTSTHGDPGGGGNNRSSQYRQSSQRQQATPSQYRSSNAVPMGGEEGGGGDAETGPPGGPGSVGATSYKNMAHRLSGPWLQQDWQTTPAFNPYRRFGGHNPREDERIKREGFRDLTDYMYGMTYNEANGQPLPDYDPRFDAWLNWDENTNGLVEYDDPTAP